MDELIKKIEEQNQKIDAMYKSVERLRKYFYWTLILTIVFFVLPLIGLIFVIPLYLNTLNVSGLGF
jgi:TRAP-type mannitol/chloroaromatic compound transport system permease small subunit